MIITVMLVIRSHYSKCVPGASSINILWALIGMQVSGSTPDLMRQSPHFNKISRWFVCTQKFKQHWYRKSLGVQQFQGTILVVNHGGRESHSNQKMLRPVPFSYSLESVSDLEMSDLLNPPSMLFLSSKLYWKAFLKTQCYVYHSSYSTVILLYFSHF